MAHRAVYETEVGPIPAGLDACHRCDVPLCVNPAHIFFGTQRDNNRDRDAKRRTARGERNNKSSLTETDVLNIRAGTTSMNAAAKIYGVSRQTISEIRRRKTWQHVE